MEVPEEKVRSHQKIHSQRKGLVDAQEKEKVMLYKSKIRAHLKRSVVEKSLSMEKEKEASPLNEMALLRF